MKAIVNKWEDIWFKNVNMRFVVRNAILTLTWDKIKKTGGLDTWYCVYYSDIWSEVLPSPPPPAQL